jgi:DNA polymerase III epsilon subunit-like protein
MASPANDKGKLKKLKKRVARGDINTVESYTECLACGIDGTPEIMVTEDPGRGQASFQLHSSELQDLLLALLYNKTTIPRNFIMNNRQFARKIVVLHFTDWGINESGIPLNLGEALGSPDGLSTALSMRISKNALHTAPLSWKLLCCSRSELDRLTKSGGREQQQGKDAGLCNKRAREDDEEGEEDAKVPMNSNSNSKKKKAQASPASAGSVDGDDNNKGGKSVVEAKQGGDLASQIKHARLLLPAALKRMWLFPLPIAALNRERGKDQQLVVTVPATAKQAASSSANGGGDGDGDGDGDDGVSSYRCPPPQIGVVGSDDGVLPCLQEARLVSSVPRGISCWDDLMHNQSTNSTSSSAGTEDRFGIHVLGRGGVVKEGYCCTVPQASAAYQALFPPPSQEQGQESDNTKMALSVCAVDCEMCMTANGHTLTRLSVLDATDNSLALDVLISPDEPITDYLTAFSGVDEASLAVPADSRTSRNAAGMLVCTRRQAQIAFLRLVTAETILIGHSVDSDMAALGVVHDALVDTASLYPHHKGFPWRSKLKTLAKDHLGMDIQKQSNSGGSGTAKGHGQQQQKQGHDSIEDARAALLLVKAKLAGGEGSGNGDQHAAGAGGGHYSGGAGDLVSILPATDTATGTGRVPVRSSICYDSSCWEDPSSSSKGSKKSNSNNDPLSGNDVSARHSIYQCIGPNTELTISATGEQTLARTKEFLRRGGGGGGEVKDIGSAASTPAEGGEGGGGDKGSSGTAIATAKIAAQLGLGMSFCYVSMRYVSPAAAQAGLEDIKKALGTAGGPGGPLVVVLAQQPLQELQQMQRQKLAVISSGGTSVTQWGHEQEKRLKEVANAANRAQVCFLTTLGSSD